MPIPCTVYVMQTSVGMDLTTGVGGGLGDPGETSTTPCFHGYSRVFGTEIRIMDHGFRGMPTYTARPARLGRAGLAGLAGPAGPGLWRGTQAVAPKASQLGCREAAPKAPHLAPKAPPSAPSPECPQITREYPGHAQCVWPCRMPALDPVYVANPLGGCRTGEDWVVSIATHGQVRARTENVQGTL
eukprot:gene11232-biopygen6352